MLPSIYFVVKEISTRGSIYATRFIFKAITEKRARVDTCNVLLLFFQTSQLIKEQLVARGFCRHAAALSFELPLSQWRSRDLPRGSNLAFSITHGPTTRQRRNLSGHTVAV